MVRPVAAYAFVTCAPDATRLAKRELARTRPSWRLSFSRPGLLTFKTDDVVALDAPAPTAFARAWGRCLGRVAEPTGIGDVLAAAGLAPTRLHVFATGDDAPLDVALPGASPGDARPGELVLDVMTAPAQPPWLGVHVHGPDRAARAGGLAPADVPADAPSRAYAKIEEAIAWAGLPIAAGHTALEIGSAPGGAALALVRRGVHVLGVDAAAMDAGVLAARGPGGAAVTHLPIKVGALRWEQLPARVDWLLCDVNLAPQVALHELARLLPPLRRAGLRGAVITLKLNEPAFVDELPRLAARIAEFGLGPVRLTHLPANRQEVCAIAAR